MSASVFASVAVAYLAGHQVGDYWLQTSAQAMRKGLPGWAARRACAAHVTVYTVTLAVFLALTAWRLGLPVSPWRAAAGLMLSAASHYFADRRTPLARVAALTGKGEFWRFGDGLASGAAHLDQAWHWVWVFAAALVTAG